MRGREGSAWLGSTTELAYFRMAWSVELGLLRLKPPEGVAPVMRP